MARPSTDDDVALLFARREAPIADLAAHAGDVAAACYAMAVRFHRGGKLMVSGTGAQLLEGIGQAYADELAALADSRIE